MRRFTPVMLALALAAMAAAPVRGAGEPGSALREVTFRFNPRLGFERVFLAGTFNGWSTDATEMRDLGGRFEVTLPLAVGDYQYKFVADGQWITDEAAAAFHPDGYGGRNSVIVVDDSFPAMELARGDGRIHDDGIAHRQDACGRSLEEDGSVTLRVTTMAGDAERVVVWLGALDGPAQPGVEASGSDGTHDYYSMVVAAEHVSQSPTYLFEIVDGDTSLWLGGSGIADDRADAGSFGFNVSSLSVFTTPDWVKDGIIYQIFPERFANGDPGNDPNFSEWYYDGIAELPPSGKTNGEYFHLVSDWGDFAGLTRSPYKTDGKPDWNSFYGGDIEGIRSNLDYLSELGITIIYLNPVFEAKSNHKYDAADFMRIDPHFGTNDEFKAFVDECHERGLRVVIDLALNHTGHTFWAFTDARENGSESEYWDWYEWKKWPVPGGKESTPANSSEYYDCWWGFGQMPNLNFDLSREGSDENGVRSIEDAAPNWPLVEHLLDVAEYWLADAGVDGYRLDVAADVPFWFWELFRERVRAVDPDAYILGELWGASPEWVNASYFDAVMNYRFFRDPVMKFIARGDITAAEFDRELAPGRFIYPDEGVRTQMNLIGSHDTERFLTTAGGDVRRLKLAALFGMTYVGAPAVYYGDETATLGGGDPDCRRPFDWEFAGNEKKADVHAYVAWLISVRKTFPVLARGGFQTLLAQDRVYAYGRWPSDGESAGVGVPAAVIVVMNAGTEEATVTVPVRPAGDLYSDGDRLAVIPLSSLPSEAVVPLADSDSGLDLTVTLPPLTGSLYAVSALATIPRTDEGSR